MGLSMGLMCCFAVTTSSYDLSLLPFDSDVARYSATDRGNRITETFILHVSGYVLNVSDCGTMHVCP